MQFLTCMKHSQLALNPTLICSQKFCLARKWKWLDLTWAILGRRDRRGKRREAGKPVRSICFGRTQRDEGLGVWGSGSGTWFTDRRISAQDELDCVTCGTCRQERCAVAQSFLAGWLGELVKPLMGHREGKFTLNILSWCMGRTHPKLNSSLPCQNLFMSPLTPH